MATVFINYRTGDGDKTALLIEQELSKIIGGKEQIFRATRSIKPGQRFPEALLNNVRRATVVLAVIGPAWTGSPKLRDRDDWVRRELLEALTLQIPVVPVLEGTGARRLNRAELPLDLKWLADIQSSRLDVEDLQADLSRLVTRLGEWIPSFKALSHPDSPPPQAVSVSNTAGTSYGSTVQGRDITTGDITSGDVSTGDITNNTTNATGDITDTFIGHNHGTAHTGRGNVYNYGDPRRSHRSRRPYDADDREDTGLRSGDSQSDEEER
ncbi:toll/interleukin-1 receptor domain-containing protein [Streptosporangium sp. NPDC023615]|uniref:toll/interleukin-1 receptor domain-containing protein n=1 Tax=Streptosporangium sp. NPDC023615 TaxID=3154794 RepID=UPI00343BAF7E